jgi:hypothetical protein
VGEWPTSDWASRARREKVTDKVWGTLGAKPTLVNYIKRYAHYTRIPQGIPGNENEKINSHRKIDRNPRFPRQRKSKRGFENGKRAVEKLLVRRRENIRIELTKQEGARVSCAS